MKYLILTSIIIFSHLVQSQNAREIVQKADEKMRGSSMQVELTIKTIRPTWTWSMEVKAWMKGTDYSMILIQFSV
jgi:hypothetical protein